LRKDEKLSGLIGRILDAALDPTQWTAVLAELCEFVDGRAAGLLFKDSISKLGNAFYQHGVDSNYMESYAETYVRFDPMSSLLFFEEGQIVTTPDLVPFDEFLRGRFYLEWVRPQGFIDAANVVLEKSATSFGYLSVVRSEAAGMVDDEMRRRLQLIIPHVRRACHIGKAIDLKQYEASTFAATLDGLDTGVFLLDAGGRIAHANRAADDMLRSGDLVRSVAGRMTGLDDATEAMLHQTFAAAGSGGASEATALPLTARDGTRYVAHVLPLTSGARIHAGAAYAADIALFVRKASLSMQSPPEAIGKAFKLTPTELRVLLAIVEVGGVAKVAAALGVSEDTVKTHLGHLFEKVGAKQQADLVKLVAAYASPLSDRP
jgi:DNA-binding CsgD family transcriptional regulator/PAS domain-containing protein